MDPVDALERIVYLLDRDLAPSPKVRAFRRAAEVISKLDPTELRSLHRTGRLQELPGIGESTGRTIAEALDGESPSYLTKLEATTVVQLGEGAEVRTALRGDCHLHSVWSDGGATIEVMARAAQALGHEYMVLTDHSPRLTMARGLSREQLADQLEEVAELNDKFAPFRILTGVEVDILEDGSLDHADEVLARLDVVVASVHSKLRMARKEMTERMVFAMANPHTDILGHCTGRKVMGPGRPQSVFDAEIVFAACARFDKAVEINCRPERQDPPEDLLAVALEWGCKVSIDTDAHTPGQLEWQPYGCDKAARLGVPLESIINTWPADDLLAWAASHGAAG
ncbi:MAG: PHP domain-containing protein [Streptosporangiales bacterium]|nr:PHP domain-containing protein [Streptosporangiales bacterium]